MTSIMNSPSASSESQTISLDKNSVYIQATARHTHCSPKDIVTMDSTDIRENIKVLLSVIRPGGR